MVSPEREIERVYQTTSRRNTYLALEDMNFTWSIPQVHEVERMWNDGCSIQEMAEKLERDPDEIVILIMDRARMDKLQHRTGGIGKEPDVTETFNKKFKRWTDAEVELLKSYYYKQMTYSQIGFKLRRTEKAIRNKIEVLRLKGKL